MNKSFVRKIASAMVIALGAIATGLPAQAGTLVNGWNYARDDYSYDGSGANGFNANSRWDIYGMGYKVVGNNVYVGINSSNSLNGVDYNGTNIGFGSLFLDFNYGKIGDNFSAAQGSMLGVRFAPNNPSGPVGVYTGVTGQSLWATNYGYSSYNAYTNAAGTSSVGDLASNDPYLAPYINGNSPLPLEIATGTLFNGGNLSYLTQQDLVAIGFPTAIALPSANPNTFGFKFTLPSQYQGQQFLATLGFECGNDQVAVAPVPVPVPPAIAGVLVAGALGGWRISKRKKQLKAVEA